nr:WD repeat and HMG-box DNA-binding protein 1 [Leptinotarsa decemlineata]
MSMEHEPLRYAHDEGHTDVCYSEDGSKFITCGADGDIRIWSCDEGEDPIHNCVGEWALCIRQKDDKLYVATGSNDIQILALPEGDRDGVLDRFVAPINHIAVEKDTQLIALAGEDMEVKLIDLGRTDKECKKFEGLSGPCLSVALNSKSKMIAAASGDSKLRVWDIDTSTLLKEISCFPKVNSFSNAKLLCRIDFESRKGKKLAYPNNNTVIILNVEDWSVDATLSCGEVSAPYSIVQYSPCGKYILATSSEGDFVIWDTASQDVSIVSKHEKSVAVCGLMWNPKGNGEIIYTDVEGQLGIITKSIKCIAQNEAGSAPAEDDAFADNDVDFTGIQFEEDDDEDNENVVSVEKLKKQYMGDSDDELKKLETESSHAPSPRPRTPEIPLQPPFMPSSTPDHLDPRYLCWNHVGIIRCYGNNGDESSSKSIEVEFHDSTFHNSMMMQNYQEYTMASLSKAALVVGNSRQLLRKGLADGFFVTAVFESYQAVGGIKCKGSVYPSFTPRPTMCEIPLEPPFAESMTEKTQMEMNLFTWSTLQVSDVDKKFKETAMKTFALACRNNLDERALEFMEVLSNPQLIALSLKYASKLDRRRLVEKLMDLATKIADDTEDLGVKEIPMEEEPKMKPVYRKLSLSVSKNTPKNKVDRLKQVSNTPDVSQTSQETEISTPGPATNNTTLIESSVNTQESLFRDEVKPNPFLKSLKKSKVAKDPNPLSLTDKYAGLSYEKETKENKVKNGETGEKRKNSDSETDKQKEKQRKLDSFRFKKSS